MINERGLKVARDVAQWRIGDRDWADVIIAAFLDPDGAEQMLKEDKGES